MLPARANNDKKDISVRNSFINWDPQLSKIDYLQPLTYSCSNIIDALLPLSSFERFLLLPINIHFLPHP